MELRCVLLLLSLSAVSEADDVLQSSCVPPVNVSCETLRLVAPRGASLLLPCLLGTRPQNVSWTHLHEVAVVTVTSSGRVNFLEPRSGRIQAFPNQGSRGNFSIAIHSVLTSDLGCYRCRHDDDCVQVELVPRPEPDAAPLPLHLYLSAAALCALFAVGLCLCVRCCLKRNKETEESSAIVDHITVHHHEADNDVSLPTQESGAAGHPEPPGSPAYENAIVYENETREARVERLRSRDEPRRLRDEPQRLRDEPRRLRDEPRRLSHKTKHRFHSELMARLRQASLRRHHYVNQRELQLEAKGQQFPNPIYSRDSDAVHFQ